MVVCRRLWGLGACVGAEDGIGAHATAAVLAFSAEAFAATIFLAAAVSTFGSSLSLFAGTKRLEIYAHVHRTRSKTEWAFMEKTE